MKKSKFSDHQKHAHSLVETTKASLTFIAMELGFSDAAHFTKSFYKHWGVTPSTLRKSAIRGLQ